METLAVGKKRTKSASSLGGGGGKRRTSGQGGPTLLKDKKRNPVKARGTMTLNCLQAYHRRENCKRRNVQEAEKQQPQPNKKGW